MKIAGIVIGVGIGLCALFYLLRPKQKRFNRMEEQIRKRLKREEGIESELVDTPDEYALILEELGGVNAPIAWMGS